VPDVLIGKTKAIDSRSDDGSSDSDAAVEACHQRPPLNGSELPEKLGELLAIMHFLAECKILRRIMKGKSVDGEASVTGMLLDRYGGVVHCKLKVKVEEHTGRNGIQVEVYEAMDGMLFPATLCFHLDLLRAGVGNY